METASEIASEANPYLGLELFAEELEGERWHEHAAALVWARPASSLGTFTSATSFSCPFSTLATFTTASTVAGFEKEV